MHSFLTDVTWVEKKKKREKHSTEMSYVAQITASGKPLLNQPVTVFRCCAAAAAAVKATGDHCVRKTIMSKCLYIRIVPLSSAP